ncbi:MAG: hypothetical protein QXT86_13850 [Archaeoglobaceae archaeon]
MEKGYIKFKPVFDELIRAAMSLGKVEKEVFKGFFKGCDVLRK